MKKFFFQNFQRKLAALITAILIWVVVNSSITDTRTFVRVPIRIINLPQDKTIRGLMPTGLLDKKLTLTLTGTRDVIDKLEPGDFEVVIDASERAHESIVQIGKKNLISLNPDIDLLHNVTNVSHNEFLLKLSKLVVDKIPIYVMPPKGEPPEGYQYLDVWPQKIYHQVSGPEEDVRQLQAKGIELIFDLSDITKEELNSLQPDEFGQKDEVSFFVPDSWKKISIPFLNGLKQEINGPEAKHLRIDFLRKELLTVEREIPITVFYPLTYIDSLNPRTCPLLTNSWLVDKAGIKVIRVPLMVRDVSSLFLDLVRERIEIIIIATPKSVQDPLHWDVQFIDPSGLEEMYVNQLLSTYFDKEPRSPFSGGNQKSTYLEHERILRLRFREYMQKFQLYVSKDAPLMLDSSITREGISVTIFDEVPAGE